MSHKATNWLSGIPATELGHSEFRVLFHLCDCHNPSAGCFPTQAYLLENSGVSNGTVNNALNALEQKGLIRRNKTWDNKTKRQRPTRYLLGFEFEKDEKPTPEIGDGADSNLRGDPSPTERASRLQPTGEEPVKKPVKNHAREEKKISGFKKTAEMWARRIAAGAGFSPNVISLKMARYMIKAKLVTKDELRRRSIQF